MTKIIVVVIFVTIWSSPGRAYAERCLGVGGPGPGQIQVPCEKFEGWKKVSVSGDFSVCIPVELKATRSNFFESAELSILIDYGIHADSLLLYHTEPNFAAWEHRYDMYVKYTSFTTDSDSDQPYRLASFIPNIKRDKHLNFFVYAKDCDAVRKGYDSLRSVKIF
jgi:hypothetical protein